MRSSMCIVVILVALLTAGCGQFLAPFLAPGAPTPEEAARASAVHRLQDNAGATFRIRGTREWEAGVVVLYSATLPATDEHPQMFEFGYSLTERAQTGWRTTGGGAGASNVLPARDELVSVGRGAGGGPEGGFALAYGEVLSPKVTAVEAVFDTGERRRDDADDGVFVLIAPNTEAVCDLYVLGENDEILRELDLRFNAAPGKEDAAPSDPCPR